MGILNIECWFQFSLSIQRFNVPLLFPTRVLMFGLARAREAAVCCRKLHFHQSLRPDPLLKKTKQHDGQSESAA
jgi:hypothetical protein